MTRSPFLRALTLAAVALVALAARRSDGAPAGDAAASQEELARSHFVAGQAEYERGRWREALHEFEMGYALSPRPEFLINFAQVHRRLGEYDAAERECRRYLATAPPPALAAQAQRLLQQIEDERAHAPATHATAPTSPAPTPTTPGPSATAPAPTTTAPAATTTSPGASSPGATSPGASSPGATSPGATSPGSARAGTTSATTTPSPSANRAALVATPPPRAQPRAWIAPVVIAGVLVVGGAVTLGLVFGLTHDTFKATPLGTVDFR